MASGNLSCFVPVIRTHLLDAAQLHTDPALAFGKIGGALAVLAAGPERHAIGLTQDAHYIVVSTLLLCIVGDPLGNGLKRENVGILDLRHLPRTIGLGFRARGFHSLTPSPRSAATRPSRRHSSLPLRPCRL